MAVAKRTGAWVYEILQSEPDAADWNQAKWTAVLDRKDKELKKERDIPLTDLEKEKAKLMRAQFRAIRKAQELVDMTEDAIAAKAAERLEAKKARKEWRDNMRNLQEKERKKEEQKQRLAASRAAKKAVTDVEIIKSVLGRGQTKLDISTHSTNTFHCPTVLPTTHQRTISTARPHSHESIAPMLDGTGWELYPIPEDGNCAIYAHLPGSIARKICSLPPEVRHLYADRARSKIKKVINAQLADTSHPDRRVHLLGALALSVNDHLRPRGHPGIPLTDHVNIVSAWQNLIAQHEYFLSEPEVLILAELNACYRRNNTSHVGMWDEETRTIRIRTTTYDDTGHRLGEHNYSLHDIPTTVGTIPLHNGDLHYHLLVARMGGKKNK